MIQKSWRTHGEFHSGSILDQFFWIGHKIDPKRNSLLENKFLVSIFETPFLEQKIDPKWNSLLEN